MREIGLSMLKNSRVLGLFAIACVGVVTLVYLLTESRIIAAQREAQGRALLELLTPGSYDNHPLDTQVLVQDPRLGNKTPLPAFIASSAGQPNAVILQATAPDGYSGNIQLLVGIAADGHLLGVRAVSHKETPGLGDKIELSKSGWVHAFVGKSLKQPDDQGWAVKKDGGEFDQFAGATITPRAVVKAVHKALQFFDEHRDRLLDPSAQVESHE